MNCNWSPDSFELVLEEALNVALNYLEATGQVEVNRQTQRVAAEGIFREWVAGTTHKIRLINAGIVAIQQAQIVLPDQRILNAPTSDSDCDAGFILT
jgi:hypothetical protein